MKTKTHNVQKVKSTAKEFLVNHLKHDTETMIGVVNENDIELVANAWMNDLSNSKHRFTVISNYFPNANKVLDMASGAGTFVYYGLLNGYDAHGVDCEEWKHEFNKMKADENNYPKEWQNNFINGFGENLPYSDSVFDITSSYQTLEHVFDPKKCISEMIRVTKSNGGIHIMCPDYRSTYEGHYNMAWLPLFPRTLANKYLKLRGRNPEYLTTINYITSRKIMKWISDIAQDNAVKLEVINLKKEYFKGSLKKRNLPFLDSFYILYSIYIYVKKLFKSEIQINIIIIKG